MTIGPHTLSRGPIADYVYEAQTSQSTKVAGDGSVAVSGSNYIGRFHRYRLRLPRAEAEELARYLENGARFAATIIPVTVNSVTRQMRFWDSRVRMTEGRGGEVSLDLLFREEVPA